MGQMPSHLLCTPNREQGHASHNSIRPPSPVSYMWAEFFTTSGPTKPTKKGKKKGEDSGHGF